MYLRLYIISVLTFLAISNKSKVISLINLGVHECILLAFLFNFFLTLLIALFYYFELFFSLQNISPNFIINNWHFFIIWTNNNNNNISILKLEMSSSLSISCQTQCFLYVILNYRKATKCTSMMYKTCPK